MPGTQKDQKWVALGQIVGCFGSDDFPFQLGAFLGEPG